MRSERPSMALIRVPQTKPTATLLVSSAAWPSEKPNSDLSDGRIAVAENHSASAITSHSDNKPMALHLRALENCAAGVSAVLNRGRRRARFDGFYSPGGRARLTPFSSIAT